ncbi:MAG: chemotaxis protein CheD [Verrucomicrobia bacterium]|nr:chemotaxis protein CheD [Verrucomicrobiota bacterium]
MPGSPNIASIFAQRVVVGVGDMSVSNNASLTLSTYALGSCVGVVAYDPAVRAGGLLHLMLPESRLSPEKAARQPAMFADTGLPLLFRALAGLRADRARLRIFVAGGANVLGSGVDNFKIGERNIRATASYLSQVGLSVVRSDVGGTINRTLHLDVGTGEIKMKTPTANETYSLAA